jgi:hypothetical protein
MLQENPYPNGNILESHVETDTPTGHNMRRYDTLGMTIDICKESIHEEVQILNRIKAHPDIRQVTWLLKILSIILNVKQVCEVDTPMRRIGYLPSFIADITCVLLFSGY